VAAAFAQESSGTSGATAPASYPVTLPGGTTSGSLVVIVVASDATVTTPAGFNLDKSQVNSNGHYVFSKVTAGGETGWTVSPTSSAAGCWYVAEISGLTATSLDQVASTGAGTTATTRSTGTTGTTAQAAELAIGSWASSVVGTAVTWGAQTNSFAERITDVATTTGGSNVALSVASVVLSATGTAESTATADAGAATKSTGIVVTYKVAAGGTVPLNAALTGSGSLAAAAGVTHPAAGALTGTGSLAAAASVTRQAAAALAGVGTLSASLTATRALSGTLVGVGHLTAGVTAGGSIVPRPDTGLVAWPNAGGSATVSPILARGRSRRLLLMRDAVVIARNGVPTFDPDTGDYTAPSDAVYEGAADVKPIAVGDTDVQAGQRETVLRRYDATLPFDTTTTFVLEDVLTVTASDDEHLIGRPLTVVAVQYGPRRTGLHLTVEDRS
jgi:hypothetical protein